jgi:hypothetical protein
MPGVEGSLFAFFADDSISFVLLLSCNLETGLYFPSIVQPDSLSFLRATCSDHFVVLRTRNVTVIRVAFRRFGVQAGARTPATLTWNFCDVLRSLQANADIASK